MLQAMRKQRPKPRARPRSGAGRPQFTVATSDDVRRAFENVDLDGGWASLAPSILPLLPRRAPSPIRAGGPLQAMLGPGILVSFGIDFGPAFATVTRSLVERWGIGDGDVVSTALGNVRSLAVELPSEVVKTVDLDRGVVVRVVQSGAGWASALLLVPDLLPRFLGSGPHLLGAPCRDVIMAFQAGTSLDLVFDLVEGLSWADPAGLVPGCYVHLDGILEPVPAPSPGSVVPLDVGLPVRTRFVS